MMCPCGSLQDYENCCSPYINDINIPPNAEALMRSRYTAYTMANMAYIKKTMKGSALLDFQEESARRFAKRVRWIKLEVIRSAQDSLHVAYVEFKATFVEAMTVRAIHENSRFLHEHTRWYYVDGTHIPADVSSSSGTLSRQSPCPCGSGKKYKNCHERQ